VVEEFGFRFELVVCSELELARVGAEIKKIKEKLIPTF